MENRIVLRDGTFEVFYDKKYYEMACNIIKENVQSDPEFDLKEDKISLAIALKISDEFNSLKLHVSIDPNQFYSFKHEIADLITTHLDKILCFKRVSTNMMEDRLDDFLTIRQLLLKYKEEPHSNIQLTSTINDLLVTNRLGYLSSYGTKEIEIDGLLEKINDGIKALERFKQGDQFTIYLPKNAKKEDVRNLCVELNNFFNENNINPGKIVDISSPITKHISARMDTLDGAYINAIKLSSESSLGNERREKVVEAQQEEPTYKYLKNHFNPQVSKSIWNIWNSEQVSPDFVETNKTHRSPTPTKK